MTDAGVGREIAGGAGLESTRLIGGRYVLEREVGRGGMGAVWRGRDQVLGRIVALKQAGMTPGEESADAARARREASLAARLIHPNVVTVFDLVQEGREQWLVMEYVEGTNLAELVRANGALSPDDAALVLAQVAAALSVAHAQGIVHRDVKPSNILVTPDGEAKLTDFGIARAEADVALTQTGLVTGSPAYLSPEVASGGSATPASDVWALGATAVHAVTGAPPYPTKENVLAALYKIVHEEPPRPTEAGWLAPLIVSTLIHEPDRRWDAATARAFLEAGPPGRPLAPSLISTSPDPGVHRPLTAAPPRPRQHERRHLLSARRPLPALAAAAAALTAVAFVGLEIAPSPDEDNGGNGTSTALSNSRTSPVEPAASTSPLPKVKAPTAGGMERFVATYLRTVARSPETAFAMLTPTFQAESGGLEGYKGFWDRVVETDLEDVDANTATMTVTYDYEYELAGGDSVEDTVRLRLVHQDGKYLIAAEPS